ncbi:MAG TPA: response regulator [Polyangiaceae bacterium]|nr:response regulator [Polyangiaceae bacterium]
MDQRILVVDDDPATLDVLERVLTAEGFFVDRYENSEAALERLESERYDVLLTDFLMPVVTGKDLVQAATRLPSSPRCLVMSGMDPDDGLPDDVTWVCKPLDIDALLRKLSD